MKRYKRIKQVSDKQRAINAVLKQIKAHLIKKLGAYCQLCGKHQHELDMPLSLFHIIPRSRAPRLILREENILLACWIKEKYYFMKPKACHNVWEHQKFLKDGSINPAWQRIEDKIKELKGEDYRDRLKLLEATSPQLTLFEIEMYSHYYEDRNNAK